MSDEKRGSFVGPIFGHYDFEKIIAHEVLNKASAMDRIRIIEEFMEVAAATQNDEAYLKLLGLLKKAYEFTAYDLAGAEVEKWKSYEQERFARNLAEKKFRERIRNIFSDLPTASSLVNSRLWIVKQISSEWYENLTPQSRSAFGFLCKAYTTIANPKERQGILQIIQEKTGGGFKPELLEEWLEEPNIPDEIQQRLVIARTRNGHPSLAKHDIRCAKLLKNFKLEERSPSAIKLAECLLKNVFLLDNAVLQLLKNMQSGWGLEREKIGESEYVVGKIEAAIDALQIISITVKLPNECAAELGADVFDRARRHVEAWRKDHIGNNVSITVEGGKSNLRLCKLYLT